MTCGKGAEADRRWGYNAGSGTTSAAAVQDLSHPCCSLLPFHTQVPQASPTILKYQLSGNTKKTNGVAKQQTGF